MKLDIFLRLIENFLKEQFEMILIAFKSGKIITFFIVIFIVSMKKIHFTIKYIKFLLSAMHHKSIKITSFLSNK